MPVWSGSITHDQPAIPRQWWVYELTWPDSDNPRGRYIGMTSTHIHERLLNHRRKNNGNPEVYKRLNNIELYGEVKVTTISTFWTERQCQEEEARMIQQRRDQFGKENVFNRAVRVRWRELPPDMTGRTFACSWCRRYYPRRGMVPDRSTGSGVGRRCRRCNKLYWRATGYYRNRHGTNPPEDIVEPPDTPYSRGYREAKAAAERGDFNEMWGCSAAERFEAALLLEYRCTWCGRDELTADEMATRAISVVFPFGFNKTRCQFCDDVWSRAQAFWYTKRWPGYFNSRFPGGKSRARAEAQAACRRQEWSRQWYEVVDLRIPPERCLEPAHQLEREQLAASIVFACSFCERSLPGDRYQVSKQYAQARMKRCNECRSIVRLFRKMADSSMQAMEGHDRGWWWAAAKRAALRLPRDGGDWDE